MKPDPGRFIEVNGVSLYVEEHGAGVPVLLMHGFPDSARLWRNQVPVLVSNGFRVITPDLRGFGRSGRPQEVAAYRLQNVVADVTGLLDAFGIQAAHVVGHDWGAAVAWLTAAVAPDRVRRLVVISVPHPLAPITLRQHEMAWYQLFFQFAGVAEATIRADDWAWLRMFSRGDGDIGQWIEELSRPGALTAALNWARANLAPRMPGPQPGLPPVQAPVLGIWSDGDRYLDGERMRQSAAWVAALRGDRGRQPLGTAARPRPAQRPAARLAALTAAVRRRSAAGTARHPMRTGRRGDIGPFRGGTP
jgi:pimeloyl-ACP methyl ester carboxylesterase